MSTSDTTNALLTANANLSVYQTTGRAAAVEGSLVFPRGTPFGESYVYNHPGVREHAQALEGSSFVAMNVPQTAILDTAALTAFAATTPTFVAFNNNTVASGRNMIPKRLRFSISAAGASGTNWLWQWIIDTGNRKTSGGTVLTVASPNLNVANTASNVISTFGAITAPAANASRIIGAGVGRTVIKVVGDEYTFEFGSSAPVAGAGMPTDGTLQLTKTFHVACPVIPPQCSLVFYEYGASQGTAAQFDNIQFEYLER